MNKPTRYEPTKRPGGVKELSPEEIAYITAHTKMSDYGIARVLKRATATIKRYREEMNGVEKSKQN